MSTAWLNGRWLADDQATIPADDPGFLQGDAVFETGRLVHGRYFRLDEHLARLAASAAALELPLPTRSELVTIARGLAQRNDFEHANLRIVVTRGGSAGPTTLATLTPLPGDWRERAARGWRVITAAVRHPLLASLPAVKTPGRLHGLLARAEARRAGADDALLLSPEGRVVEGPSWNVFWRTGGTLFTPTAATGLLEGVTRAEILRLAPRLDYECIEGRFARATLDAADEIFATMTSSGVVPFVSLDGRKLACGPGTAADALQAAYWSLVETEAA